jgi:hypothetical protein
MMEMRRGIVIFAGDYNWRKGPKIMALRALLFGRTERFESLGMRATVKWFKGQPYLIRFRPLKSSASAEARS